jgi:hypothetical protein
MNTVRLVKDGAQVFTSEGDGTLANAGNDIPKMQVTYYANCYTASDTIPIESPWTVEEAAVLLGINSFYWSMIYQLFPRYWEKVGNRYRKGFSDYLHELISLSIAHDKSGLSPEQFIEAMKEYSNG